MISIENKNNLFRKGFHRCESLIGQYVNKIKDIWSWKQNIFEACARTYTDIQLVEITGKCNFIRENDLICCELEEDSQKRIYICQYTVLDRIRPLSNNNIYALAIQLTESSDSFVAATLIDSETGRYFDSFSLEAGYKLAAIYILLKHDVEARMEVINAFYGLEEKIYCYSLIRGLEANVHEKSFLDGFNEEDFEKEMNKICPSMKEAISILSESFSFATISAYQEHFLLTGPEIATKQLVTSVGSVIGYEIYQIDCSLIRDINLFYGTKESPGLLIEIIKDAVEKKRKFIMLFDKCEHLSHYHASVLADILQCNAFYSHYFNMVVALDGICVGVTADEKRIPLPLRKCFSIIPCE